MSVSELADIGNEMTIVILLVLGKNESYFHFMFFTWEESVSSEEFLG